MRCITTTNRCAQLGQLEGQGFWLRQDDELEGWLRKALEVDHLSLSLEPRHDPAATATTTGVLPLLRCAKLQVEHWAVLCSHSEHWYSWQGHLQLQSSL